MLRYAKMKDAISAPRKKKERKKKKTQLHTDKCSDSPMQSVGPNKKQKVFEGEKDIAVRNR